MTLSELIDLYKKGELSDNEGYYVCTFPGYPESSMWMSYEQLSVYVKMVEEMRRKSVERFLGIAKDEQIKKEE